MSTTLTPSVKETPTTSACCTTGMLWSASASVALSFSSSTTIAPSTLRSSVGRSFSARWRWMVLLMSTTEINEGLIPTFCARSFSRWR